MFAALHYYLVTEINRPWPPAITLLTKYLPAPLEDYSWMTDSHYDSVTLGVKSRGIFTYSVFMGIPVQNCGEAVLKIFFSFHCILLFDVTIFPLT